MSEPSSPTPTDPPAHARLHATVHGLVQGVGFRMFTQRTAAQLELTGWVKNNWAGTVETLAEGPRSVLESFEQALNAGPRGSYVERVESTYSAATGEFNSFNIRYWD